MSVSQNLLHAGLKLIELIKIIETASKTIRAEFIDWFRDVPAAASWTISSDYCLGDKNKKSDAFSFVIVLKHDSDENIATYIANAAPHDIKSTRQVPAGILDYLSSPVTFSQSFVVERESFYLKEALSIEAMLTVTTSLKETVKQWSEVEPANQEYYGSVERKLNHLTQELTGKRPSTALLRRMFLVTVFASVVISMINDEKSALNIRWISDRDAMFDRYDGVAFDISWILFQLLRRNRPGVSVIDVRRPQISFATPMMDGMTEYAEFVRLPDYLAGTLADLRLPQVMFTHRKYPQVFNRIYVDAKNNAVVEIVKPAGMITARRIAFGAPPKGAKTKRSSDGALIKPETD